MSCSSSSRLLTVLLGIVLMLAAIPALSRGPSTPEERQKALSMIRSLEENPLQENYKDMRAWLMQWLTDIPDIEVKVCSGPLQPLLDEKVENPFGPDIFFQTLLSSAAFIIEHPDKAQDQVAIYQAGLEGVLKVYQFYLTKDANTRRKYIDELLAKQSDGKLEEVAIKAVKKCK